MFNKWIIVHFQTPFLSLTDSSSEYEYNKSIKFYIDKLDGDVFLKLYVKFYWDFELFGYDVTPYLRE